MRATLMVLRPLVILAAAGIGLLVLLVSFAGDATGEPGVGTPERLTAEEVSTRSAVTSATEVARRNTTLEDLLQGKMSVAKLHRSPTTGFTLVPPVTVEEARGRGAAFVVGTVEDQYLARGPHPSSYVEALYLISRVRVESTGEELLVSRTVGFAMDFAGTALTYSDEPLPETGRAYAFFTTPIEQPASSLALAGQTYFVNMQGQLEALYPSTGNRELEGKLASEIQ